MYFSLVKFLKSEGQHSKWGFQLGDIFPSKPRMILTNESLGLQASMFQG